MVTLSNERIANQEEILVDLTDENDDNNCLQGLDSSSPLLCRYMSDEVRVCDYITLEDGGFLNDSVIDFYLKYLHSKLPKHTQEGIHIYSTHFYTNLKRGQEDAETNEPNHNIIQKNYPRAKTWTKNLDIFSKRILVFPICEDLHWHLVIVCNPGLASPKRTKDSTESGGKQQNSEQESGNPYVLVLNSMEETHSFAVDYISAYLELEHLERKGFPLDYGSRGMSEEHPPIPQQTNFSDCGVFLLHYAELIFQDPNKFLGAELPDLSNWFSQDEITKKRSKIAEEIKNLASSQNVSLDLFPDIKFPKTSDGPETPMEEETPASDQQLPSSSSDESAKAESVPTSISQQVATEDTPCEPSLDRPRECFMIPRRDEPERMEKANQFFDQLMRYTKNLK